MFVNLLYLVSRMFSAGLTLYLCVPQTNSKGQFPWPKRQKDPFKSFSLRAKNGNVEKRKQSSVRKREGERERDRETTFK